jgi:hypothetical protein
VTRQTVSGLDEDAATIRSITQRLAELRCQRVLTASRLASELEAAARPLRDANVISLIGRLQARLAALLPEPDGDGPVSG